MDNNCGEKQNEDVKPVVIPMALQPQTGKVFIGPGAEKEAQMIGLGLSKLTTRQKDDLERAKRYAMEQSIKHVMMRQQLAIQEQQKKITMYSQALSLMSRVYIGSISFEVREEQIKENFSMFGPIKSINMSWDAATGHHKGFAFLEYEVPEAAVLAQDTMNGKLVGGRNLKVLPKSAVKVGRPANMPQAQPIIEMVMQEAKQYNRVYVASVHPDLSEKDLRMVFEAFGNIIKCQLAKQPGGRGHRGFGYLEFENSQAVRESIEGMNNFDLGGQHLQVGRCITPPDALTYIMPSSTQSALPTASAVAAAAVTAKIQAAEAVASKSSPNNNGMSPSVVSPMEVTSGNSPNHDNGRVASPSMRFGSPAAFDDVTQPAVAMAPAPARRRLGGFAAVPVAAPSVSVLPPPSIVQPNIVVPPPALYTPPVGFVPPIGVVKLEPPMKTEPQVVSYASAYELSQPQAAYGGGYPVYGAVLPLPPVEEGEPSKPKVESFVAPQPPKVKEKKNLISRIKLKEQKYETTERASFAPLPSNIAPRDRVEEERTAAANGHQLAIEGNGRPTSSTALALRDGGGELMKVGKDETKSAAKNDGFRKKKKVKPAKDKRPKLNTPQALAAAEMAGVVNDQMQAVQSQNEEATIASQENVEIRGNDARHLLMHKLMRTNRSSVICIRNMVTAEEVDDQLDEEIRSECGKHGTIVKVILVKDEDNADAIRVFVKYTEPTQADAARAVLDKRYFAGRTISVVSYDQILFDHGDYTG